MGWRAVKHRLTPREWEAFLLIGEGSSYADAAEAMGGLSERTVAHYAERIARLVAPGRTPKVGIMLQYKDLQLRHGDPPP